MDLLHMYQEPLFWLFPMGATVVSIVAFAVFATPLTWLAVADPEWARPYKIQTRRPDPKTVIWPAIRLWLRNNLAMTALAAVSWPLLRLSSVHCTGLPSLPEVIGHLLLFLLVDDFLYYWMHRAFHTKWLYRHVHRVHHKVVTPWAVTGHHMHWIE